MSTENEFKKRDTHNLAQAIVTIESLVDENSHPVVKEIHIKLAKEFLAEVKEIYNVT